MQRTQPHRFLTSRDLQSCSVSPTLFLTQQTNSFPCCATLRSVRMVPRKGVSQWSLPCTLTLKGTQGSGWVGGVAPTPALSEISMLLLVKVSPETDQRQNSTHGGGAETTHPGASSLLRPLSVLASPLRSFWSGFPGL